jgi:hypothetical protein
LYSDSLAIARLSRTSALSGWGREECVVVPVAVTVSSAETLSWQVSVASIGRPSPRASSQPPSVSTAPASTLSQCWVASQVPLYGRASSSQSDTTTMSRSNRAPSETCRNSAAIAAAFAPFMSIAPRPYRKPSRICARNGSPVHRSRSTETTSECPRYSSGAAFPAPGTRAMQCTLSALGVSMISVETP